MTHSQTLLLHPIRSRQATCSAAHGARYPRRTHRFDTAENEAGREHGLDRTLGETFPCSDPLSSIPNPHLEAREFGGAISTPDALLESEYRQNRFSVSKEEQ
jgi:hypothetical protein